MDKKIEQLDLETTKIFDEKINDLQTIFNVIRKKICIKKLDKITNELYQISSDEIAHVAAGALIDTKTQYIKMLTDELEQFDINISLDKLINIIDNENNIIDKDTKIDNIDDKNTIDLSLVSDISCEQPARNNPPRVDIDKKYTLNNLVFNYGLGCYINGEKIDDLDELWEKINDGNIISKHYTCSCKDKGIKCACGDNRYSYYKLQVNRSGQNIERYINTIYDVYINYNL